MKNKLIALSALCLLAMTVQGCSTAASGGASEAPPARTSAPSSERVELSSFKAGETTADEVRAKLGKPFHEDRNPDGRFVYLYQVSRAVTAAFLFDPEGKLIRIRAYEDRLLK